MHENTVNMLSNFFLKSKRRVCVLSIFIVAFNSLFLSLDGLAADTKVERSNAPAISNVTAEPKVFNAGDKIEFGFKISQAAKVALNVYDARGYLVWSKSPKKNLGIGEHEISWNGKSKRNKALQPEVYYYTISATNNKGETSLYDLTDITGGERIYAQNIKFDAEKNQVNYMLPSSARFFLRYGIDQGPMLGTLVNSAVQPFGLHTVPWDGKDNTKVFELSALGKIKFGISGFALPRNALIYQGQGAEAFGPTKWAAIPANKKIKRASKPDRTRNVHIHRFQDRESSKDFKIKLLAKSKKTTSQGFAVADESIRFRVDIAEEDKAIVEAQRFEVSFFVNNKLVHENEVSYVPYTWHMPNMNLSKGEHMLTALVVGFGNHFGVVSTKFSVE